MTYKYRPYSTSERISGIPRPALLDLFRHHVAMSLLARPCPAATYLCLAPSPFGTYEPMLLPDKAFLEARYLELTPEGVVLTFQTLSCDKVEVPRHELCLRGIIQLSCCNMKCSKLFFLFFFLVFRNQYAHLKYCYVTTTEKKWNCWGKF